MSEGKQEVIEEDENILRDAEKMALGLKTRPAFLLCIAAVSPEKDKDGNRVIEYRYIRRKMGMNEVEKAIKAFWNHYQNDKKGVTI